MCTCVIYISYYIVYKCYCILILKVETRNSKMGVSKTYNTKEEKIRAQLSLERKKNQSIRNTS